MDTYKYAAQDHKTVIRNELAWITEGGKGWPEYQQWIADGGITEPWKTPAELQEYNAAQARAAQRESSNKLEENAIAIQQGLPPLLDPDSELSLQNRVQMLQGDIDHPTDSEDYEPPTEPPVAPPEYDSVTATVTRVPGWQDVLGYRFVINAHDPEFSPGSLAMAVYSDDLCEDYMYTTGAFQHDEETNEWFAICPPGQEPGDESIHFGMLNGSAKISCFTLPQGVQEQTFNSIL